MTAAAAAKAEKRDILTEILYLGLTAPDDDKLEQCVNLAELLAATMSPEDIEVCKAAALELTRKAPEGSEVEQ